MKVSVETSDVQIVRKLFSCIDLKKFNVNFKHYDNDCNNFKELLHFLKVLWADNSIEVNVLNNIIMQPQRLYDENIIVDRDYNIYKTLFNNKNYLPDVIILLYDENTEFIENFLNDPLFEKKVYKIQLEKDTLDNTVYNMKNVLSDIYLNINDDTLNFRYFEQCYSNYKSIDDK
jgi:hypothetical protein